MLVYVCVRAFMYCVEIGDGVRIEQDRLFVSWSIECLSAGIILLCFLFYIIVLLFTYFTVLYELEFAYYLVIYFYIVLYELIFACCFIIYFFIVLCEFIFSYCFIINFLIQYYFISIYVKVVMWDCNL